MTACGRIVKPVYWKPYFFNFQTIRERKIENKQLGRKKVSYVFTQYVCFVFVRLFVCRRSTDVIV